MILSYVYGDTVNFCIELKDRHGHRHKQWMEGTFEDYDGPYCVISQKYVGFQTEDIITRRVHYSDVREWQMITFVDRLLGL